MQHHVIPGVLERSTLQLDGGYTVNVLRTPKEQRLGRRNFLYSGGLCIPNSFAKPLHVAYARKYDLAAVDINGFDVGGTPPHSIDELVHVHRLVVDALGWNDKPYDAGGHSTGATVARGLCLTNHPPERLTLIQPILANEYTPQELQKKVEWQCRLWYWLAGVRYPLNTAMREFIRRKIEHQYENWMRLVENGTAQDLLEDITGLSYADRPVTVPGVAYVSRFDDLFPSTDALSLADFAAGTPNVDIVDLQHQEYGHTWPLTSEQEAVRVLVDGEEPLRATVYTKTRAQAQEHPVQSALMMVGAVSLGLLAVRKLRHR